MTAQDMINRVLRNLPQATSTTISQQSILNELNHGVDQANLVARGYWGTLSYNLPALNSWMEFSLSSCFPRYLGVKKTGLWFFDANGNSKYIYAKTKRWLDNHILNWRNNQGSSVPTWSYIEGDTWFFYPFVNVSGCKATIDCLLTAVPMTNNTNYPWNNSTTELTAFRPFDDAICAYAIWKIAPAVFDKEGRNVAKQDFDDAMKLAISQYKNKENLVSDIDYRMELDFQSGFLPNG
jgi:hypothetical protein